MVQDSDPFLIRHVLDIVESVRRQSRVHIIVIAPVVEPKVELVLTPGTALTG